LHLVELGGFVEPADRRLDIFVESAPGVAAAHVVGAYAAPLCFASAADGDGR
jgi:hypothetical protein